MGILLPPYYLTPFLLLFIFFNNVDQRNLVFADDALIETQCHNAEVPETCIKCIKSDPRSQSADKVGIAAIIITCLSNKATTLINNMTTLALGARDKYLKLALRGCGKEFYYAKTNLTVATNRLKGKEYDQTNLLVKQALEGEVVCKMNVGALRFNFPNSVTFDMGVYEELSTAVMRIVDRFV
ncbi:hypothetical protein ES319_A11G315500v1 [Gossypium barbadense]|uniref:Pectinesterase inhibitor domain-containing protein n=1 Tax=Gossypium barbadense TaxID=3634 RepID=A0A2P5WZQ1_GOSBA|nr:hypothetical protein ES319_A11G315500v1 [Gossypium barbadense]PPR96531.1 hypothetical protein GOBAR_AA24146 [Gossypium barbadense]